MVTVNVKETKEKDKFDIGAIIEDSNFCCKDFSDLIKVTVEG